MDEGPGHASAAESVEHPTMGTPAQATYMARLNKLFGITKIGKNTAFKQIALSKSYRVSAQVATLVALD